ncbi:MAG: hypothetical protein AB7F59_06475 [Bdellovibrionales bacterium]
MRVKSLTKKKTEDKRIAPRKNVLGLEVKNLTALEPFSILARKAILIDASSSGLLLRVDRKDLIPRSLRSHLTLSSIEGEHVLFHIKEMDLEMDGKIARTRFIGDSTFEVAIDFTAEAPEYWRESLMDLLPTPEEFEEH